MKLIYHLLDHLKKVRVRMRLEVKTLPKVPSTTQQTPPVSATRTTEEDQKIKSTDIRTSKSGIFKRDNITPEKLRHTANELQETFEAAQEPQVSTSCQPKKPSDEQHNIVDILEAQRFVTDVFCKLHVPECGASQMSDALLAANYFGHDCMGIHRLPVLMDDLVSGRVCASAEPTTLNETCALALVSGNNAPGSLVANYCMDLAVSKARSVGFGWVAARDSNCIGMASWYACQAMEQGMIGLCMSNATPTLVAAGGVEPVLGANPIACVAGKCHQQLIVDMSMAAVPIERFELDYAVSGGQCGVPPCQTALDGNGRGAQSPFDMLSAQRLRAFEPEHKGYGLAAMVDVLCGVLTGANYATQVPRRALTELTDHAAGLGQVFIAINPDHFGSGFHERLQDFICDLQMCTRSCESMPVLAPGDMEMMHMQMVDNAGGISLSARQLELLNEVADQLSILPLQLK